MKSFVTTLVKTLNLTRKNIFLFDGLGAALSFALLLAIHNYWSGYLGMPPFVLQSLALVAFLFMTYSISCYFLKPKRWKSFLKMIAYANIAYSIATVALLFIHINEVTLLGISYFVSEAFVIIVVANCEFHLIGIDGRTLK